MTTVQCDGVRPEQRGETSLWPQYSKLRIRSHCSVHTKPLGWNQNFDVSVSRVFLSFDFEEGNKEISNVFQSKNNIITDMTLQYLSFFFPAESAHMESHRWCQWIMSTTGKKLIIIILFKWLMANGICTVWIMGSYCCKLNVASVIMFLIVYGWN